MSLLKNLQEASSLSDLSNILGFQSKSLSYILYKLPPEQKYKSFQLPKKSGGFREVRAPIEQLKLLQRRLANVLYCCRDEIDVHHRASSLSHGFRRGHSIVTNAAQHTKRRYVLNFDLVDFFPSINFGRVRGFFIKNSHFQLNESIATLECHLLKSLSD